MRAMVASAGSARDTRIVFVQIDFRYGGNIDIGRRTALGVIGPSESASVSESESESESEYEYASESES